MTLKDVALKAGCSVATVSKALKNSSEISEDAKKRILSVAKEIGYLKKATTHKAVLGGFKTVILNDIKGDSAELYAQLKPIAKKQGLTLIYVSLSEKDGAELLNQLGAFGLILKGSAKAKNEEKVFVLEGEVSNATDFLKEISQYRPGRPSRAKNSSSKSAVTRPKAEPKVKTVEEVKKQPEPVSQKKEEIWLL